MQSTGANLEALQAAGYSFEYPGFWSKTVGDYCITISDGVSINGVPYEVQIMSADGSECVHGCEHGFATAAEAVAHADAWIVAH